MAANYKIPEHSDFNVVFSPVTKDGNVLDFSTVGGWIFALDPDINVIGTPAVLKTSTGVSSGDFTIDGTAKSVSIFVGRNEVSGDSQFYATLAAETSGIRTGSTTISFRIGAGLPLE